MNLATTTSTDAAATNLSTNNNSMMPAQAAAAKPGSQAPDPDPSAAGAPQYVPGQKLLRRGHQQELMHAAKNLCDHQDFVDLVIYCEDGVVRAHQLLLAVASPFLKLLFQSSPCYGIEEISLILPEIKTCLVQALIHFVYTGTVVSKEDHFYSLMKLVYALNINASIEAESTNDKPTTFSAIPILESPLKRKNAFLPQHPVPLQHNPSKVPRLSAPAQPVMSAKMPPSIQLPTQPVPLVNGIPATQGQHQVKVEVPVTSAATNSYIAIDPNTGLSYKVELPNGQIPQLHAAPAAGSGGDEDPLAAIMNQTIFTESSGGTTTMYTTENGQVVYATQPAGATVVTSMASATAPAVVQSPAANKAATNRKRRQGGKENLILADSVDDLPCAPDDEDINTPYSCEHCNKTIKGRVMLQAHQYQEHYENPEADRLDIGDKHACRVCLKLFTRNSDVKAHILRVHCGDRRYPCTMCGKRFKESTHLRKHLYTHTGERPHFCQLCNKGFQTSSDLKRHKRTRVHQERVEQSGGQPPSAVAPDDANAEFNRWTDEEESATDSPNAHAQQVAAHAQADTTAQALLNNITQPLAMTQPTGVPGQTSFATVVAAAPPAASTIDMKALGAASWNNNTTTTTSSSASTTLDLKAIAGGSTVDMNALKWQQQQHGQNGQMSKRSSSVDSPGPDEERLTVVEGDDSSQDVS